MARITITEALAEIKTIQKRLEKKQEFVKQYLIRPENVRDPLDKEGGSEKRVGEEVQAIMDLYQRWVDLRIAIQRKNTETIISVEGTVKTVAEWLVWRREIATSEQNFWNKISTDIAGKTQYRFTNAANQVETWNAVLSYPVTAVQSRRELLEKLLGNLDGQLSLLNATVFVEV